MAASSELTNTFSGRPAYQSSASRMMPSDTVWPRSGWATMSASAITAAGSSGTSSSLSDARSMRRVASRCEPQMANAILVSSEGCMDRPGEHEPAAGAVGLVADPGDQHQHQHDDGQREGRERGAAQEAHRQPQRDPAGEQAEDGPQHLAGEDRPRRAVLVVGVHAGGRQHHGQAEGDQQRGHRHDQVERRHRPAQPGAELLARLELGLRGRLGGRHRGRLGAGFVGRLGVRFARGVPTPQPAQDVAAHGHYRAAARTAAANASPRSA